ncbi:MAG TPA: prepilin peptidase [Acidimicrobiia bacterium]|nr:prepilin peptidase [Acidimicrobiia bacterium]
MIDDTGVRLAFAGGIAALGLAVGSFLNVVIWRVPRKESVVRPASRCPSCEAPIRPFDNIPIASWLLLKGRCRSCHVGISVRYPLVELATGMLFGVMAWRFQLSWALPAFVVLAAVLFAISVIDLEHYIVPNRILVVAIPLGVGLLAVAAVADGAFGALGRAVLGAAVGFLGLLVVHLISPRGMGMGDVKLAFLLGLHLAWLSWGHVALGLFLGFLYGAVVGILLVATGLRTRREAVPFAPFLAGGTFTAIVWGQSILDWYARQ